MDREGLSMDDLISRQALCEYVLNQKDKSVTPNDIMRFPSAQPECVKEFVMLKVIDLNGRPYYSIIYLENGNEFEGYSSYDLKVISEYLKRYFGFAQPERKTGKWEIYVISMFDGEGCRCSECGLEGVPYWDFCPNCGADMRGEQDG